MPDRKGRLTLFERLTFSTTLPGRILIDRGTMTPSGPKPMTVTKTM
jgi:hypothetical protein